MTFSTPQRAKPSLLGRLQIFLGTAPQPPKAQRAILVSAAERAEAYRPHPKSEFGRRGRAKQN